MTKKNDIIASNLLVLSLFKTVVIRGAKVLGIRASSCFNRDTFPTKNITRTVQVGRLILPSFYAYLG